MEKWTCSCGATADTFYCGNCGSRKPPMVSEKAARWGKLMGVFLEEKNYSFGTEDGVEAAERAFDAAAEMFKLDESKEKALDETIGLVRQAIARVCSLKSSCYDAIKAIDVLVSPKAIAKLIGEMMKGTEYENLRGESGEREDA